MRLAKRTRKARLARASLVEATAKVDVELEQIRKLKELNREVAIKNQKLFSNVISRYSITKLDITEQSDSKRL